MRVEILSVDGDEPARVTFATAVGRGTGLWSGARPAPGETRDVELSVEDTLSWGRDLVATTATTPRLAPSGEGLLLDGTLESCDTDGTAVVRVGQSLVMLATEGAAPPAGTTVRATIARVTLFDTNL